MRKTSEVEKSSKSPLRNVKATILDFHQLQHFLFLICPVFPTTVSCCFFLYFNLPTAQLSIFICNLSFSANTLSLSCLLSRQRHCASPLIEFWSYPLRCSCLSASYLMSLAASLPSCVLRSFQTCFRGRLVIFSHLSVTFLFAWNNARFSLSAFCVGLNILCRWLPLSRVCLSCSTFPLLWIWPLPHTAGYCPEGHFYFLVLTCGSFLAV